MKHIFRSLLKNKTFSFLNIFGLAVGIACAGLIFLWVEDEVQYDNVNVKKDRLYAVMINWPFAGVTTTMQSSQGLLGPAIKKDIPGIANACRIIEAKDYLLDAGKTKLYAKGSYADASIFTMFTIPFVQGNVQSAFNQPNSLVITESTAKKYFGSNKEVIGKTIKIDNRDNYTVTGVVKDAPLNTTLQFEWLAPFEVFAKEHPQSVDNWGNMAAFTYVELQPNASEAFINKQLYSFIIDKYDAKNTTHAFLFNMKKWRLYSDFANGKPSGKGRIENVKLLTIIAWVILIIACINFMNLATASSENKAREVGVKKVLGSGKGRLMVQFMAEALLTSMLAGVVAIVLILIALPAFNMLVEKQLSLNINVTFHLTALLVITLVCGLIAGSYPSLYLSSFKPIIVLKGLSIKKGGATLFRKSLVVLQFTFSIIFIIGTIVVYCQIEHTKNRDLGLNKNNLLEVNTQADAGPMLKTVRQQLLHTGLIESVSLADHSIMYDGNSSDNVLWQGRNPSDKIQVTQRTVTPEFFSTAGMTLLEGRQFSPAILPDTQNVIVTQSLEALMGKGSAIGKVIDASTWNRPSLRVIGVVKNYMYGNMYSKPDPVIFFCGRWGSKLYIRPKTAVNPQQALAAVEKVIKKENPAYPFEYRFVDDQFNAMFSTEIQTSKLAGIFAVLAIVISCLGLFGLAAYTAEGRKKEIGIRKVLGATVAEVTALLSKDFLQLVGVACLISFPLAGWFMHNWLQQYEYRINLSWWIFLLAGIAAIGVAVFTISFQTIKAALANPVKALRNPHS